MKQKILFILILCFGLVSCKDLKNDALTDVGTGTSIAPPPMRAPIQLYDMAYTSAHELYNLYVNDPTNVINYNVARLLAETELMAGANFALSPNVDPYDDWYLTPLPKVVYNYDNTPKYYEFGYVVNNQIVATITTYAQKEIAGVIAYLFNDPLNYDCDELDYYIGNYPNRYYGMNGLCTLKDCDEIIDFNLPDHGSTDEDERILMFNQMTQEDLDGIQEDLDNSGESIEGDIDDRDAYWQLVDEYISTYYPDMLLDEDPYFVEPEGLVLLDFVNNNISSESDEEAQIINQLLIDLDYTVGYFNTYTLDEYSNPNLQVTHWSGYCGPAACAWVYRGKYDSFNNHYLPIYGDGNQYNSHYQEITSNQHPYAYYDFYSVNHADSLSCHTALYNYTTRSNVTDYGLTACFYNETVPFIWDNEWQFPLYHGGLNRGFATATNNEYHVEFTCKPLDFIFQETEPVIIAIDCNHYIVAFGYGATLDGHGNVKDKYFMVTDNGLTTAPSYHPQMRRMNFWNLHYGLKH